MVKASCRPFIIFQDFPKDYMAENLANDWHPTVDCSCSSPSYLTPPLFCPQCLDLVWRVLLSPKIACFFKLGFEPRGALPLNYISIPVYFFIMTQGSC